MTSLTDRRLNRFAGRHRAWLPVLTIVVVWAACYLTRPSALPLRGEEPRRARIAQEMIDTGDYFVSRVQGVPELGRPPLSEWAIVGSSLLFGELSPQAIRFPAAAAVLVTALAQYFYVRRTCGIYGGAAAALVYLSFGQMLQMGRVAESDSLYTALTAAALLGWHHGYVSGRPAWQVWSWGYGCAALAVLAKSPQAGVYFVLAVTAFLVVRRDWRFPFAPGHLVGVLVGALVFAAWAVPYCLTENFDLLYRTLFRHIADRRVNAQQLIGHLLLYPWQVLGATLPWSVMLVRYADRRFWRELGTAREVVIFCGTAVFVTLPTVWWSWGTMPRHFMTMYPCLAVLAAVVIERSLVAEPATSLDRGWRWFGGAAATAALVGVAGLGIASLGVFSVAGKFAQPLAFLIAFAAAATSVAGVVWWSLRNGEARRSSSDVLRRFAGFSAIVVLLGLFNSGLAVNLVVAESEDHAVAMRHLKERLPPRTDLVSLGYVDAVFTFHYRDPIRMLPMPQAVGERPDVGDYFAFDPILTEGREPDFAWDRVAVFVCDRLRHEVPQRQVVVGRRIAEVAAAAAGAGRH